VFLHIYRAYAQQNIIQEWCVLQLEGMDFAVPIATRAFQFAFASVNPWDNASTAENISQV
jgi:hypothetical protein